MTEKQIELRSTVALPTLRHRRHPDKTCTFRRLSQSETELPLLRSISTKDTFKFAISYKSTRVILVKGTPSKIPHLKTVETRNIM